MSRCPSCGGGQGNFGDVCRKCEELERRQELLTEEAARLFAATPKTMDECVACTREAWVVNTSGEPLCEICHINRYVEVRMW